MSDIVIVSQDRWRNSDPDEGRVPAGTVWFDVEGDVEMNQSDGVSVEALLPGAVPAVSWT